MALKSKSGVPLTKPPLSDAAATVSKIWVGSIILIKSIKDIIIHCEI